MSLIGSWWWNSNLIILTPVAGGNEYDETNRLITIISLASETDLATFIQSQLVSINYISVETDRADFLANPSIVSTAILNETNQADYIQLMNITALASLTETDQADYLQAPSLTITAVITETDEIAGAFNETGRSLVVVAILDQTTILEATDLLSITLVSALTAIAKANYSALPDSTITSSFLQTDLASYNESILFSILSDITEIDTPGGAEAYDETERALIIQSILDRFDYVGVEYPENYSLKAMRNRALITQSMKTRAIIKQTTTEQL